MNPADLTPDAASGGCQPARPTRGRTSLLALSTVLVACSALTTGGCARSRTPQLNVMAGYAELEGAGGVRGGVGLDWAVGGTADNGSGARLGGRVMLGTYDSEEFGTEVSPQAVASYRHVFGDHRGGALFVEPGLGAGVAIADEDDDRRGGLDFGPDVGLVLNPLLRGGVARERFTIGAEAGYQHPVSGDLDGQWYLGLFLGFPVGR